MSFSDVFWPVDLSKFSETAAKSWWEAGCKGLRLTPCEVLEVIHPRRSQRSFGTALAAEKVLERPLTRSPELLRVLVRPRCIATWLWSPAAIESRPC